MGGPDEFSQPSSIVFAKLSSIRKKASPSLMFLHSKSPTIWRTAFLPCRLGLDETEEDYSSADPVQNPGFAFQTTSVLLAYTSVVTWRGPCRHC